MKKDHFRIMGIIALLMTQNSYAAWETKIVNDPMDGKTISVYSKLPKASRGNQRIPVPGAFLFMCQNKKTQLAIFTQAGVGISTPISIKIDDSATETLNWNYEKNAMTRRMRATAEVTYPKNPKILGSKMTKGKKLLVRFDIPRLGIQLFQFDLSDFSKAIKPLSKECNW